MDPTSFDRLSRAFATTPSRRTAMGAIAAALAGLLSRFGATTAVAQDRTCRRLGKACLPERGQECCHGTCQDGRCRCRASQRPCRGRCIPKRKCCRNWECPGRRVCRQGRCQCPAGKRRCGPRCIAKSACCRDQECGVQGHCVGGRCRCAAGFKPCQGTCIAADACCGGCPGGQVCVHGTCADLCNGQCVMFTTSTAARSTGTFGGLAGADAICNQRAVAANLPGTYRAWLSSRTVSATDRLHHAPGQYVRTDGEVVAADWAALTSGSILVALDRDEFGNLIDDISLLAWTNTNADGSITSTADDGSCANWAVGTDALQGEVGRIIVTDEEWTAAGTLFCDVRLRLYCVQQTT